MDGDDDKFTVDWRVAFGLGLTVFWITAGMAYLFEIVGLDNFVHLPTADIGSFLEGAFAPLAFLWLVVGHFMQQKEISANTRAIRIQERSARRLEVHSQRDSYFKLLTLVQDQLGAIAAFLYMSVCGPTGTGTISSEEFATQRTRAGSSDHAWFIRKLVALAVDHRHEPEVMQEIFFGTEVRTRHSDNFTRTFEKLLNAARQVDTEDMVSDALLNGSASGMLYSIIQHVRGEELIDSLFGIAQPTPGQVPQGH